MSTLTENYKILIQKLKDFRDKELRVAIAGNSLIFLVLVFVSVFGITLLESIFYFSVSVKIPLFFLILTGYVAALIYLIIYPYSEKFASFSEVKTKRTAEKIGGLYTDIKDELLNQIQIAGSAASDSNFYSNQLIQASFNKFFKRTIDTNFSESISYSKPKRILPYTIIIVLAVTILTGFVPNFNSALFRLYNYNKEFIPPQRFNFSVSPGNISIAKNQNVTISVKVNGEKPKNVYLFYKDETQSGFSNIELQPDSLGTYKSNFANVRNSITYYAKAEEAESERYEISVIDRPIIKNLTLKINPPAYSGIPRAEQIDNGNFEALSGSVVSFSVISSKELKEAYILINDSVKSYFRINSNLANGSLKVNNSFQYKIILRDLYDNFNLSPVEYSVKATYDGYPLIKVIEPDADVNIGSDERVALLLKIQDDFGFSKLNLSYRLSSSIYENPSEEYETTGITIDKSAKDEDVNYIWNLKNLNLATEDVVSYYLEIFDNDAVSGPKSVKTPIYRLRMPSLAEMFKETEKEENIIEKDLKEALNQAQELKKDLEKLNNDLKEDKKELTWDEKEKIQKTAENFDKLNQKIEDISKKLEETRKELQDNNLLSPETLEKYMELQKLLDELSDDEMKDAMKKMNEQLQNMLRQQAQQQLDNMKFDEEMFNKSIERTLNLFKRIQAERKLEELVKRTEELINKQEETKNQLNDKNLSQKEERDKLAKQQERISEELKNIAKEMDKLQEKMMDLKDLPNKEMSELNEEFDEQKNDELSEEAKENLQKMQKQQAMNSQSQVSKNLSKLKQSLENMQNMMQQQNQMKAFADMVKMLDDLISLSKDQEKLRDNTQNSRGNSSSSENAGKQNSLKDNLERLLNRMNELAQKSFAITPEMGKSLGDARKNMNRALESLQNKNSQQAAASQTGSMKSLNEAASLMKGMMDQMMQGGQGGQGGMMSMMQQMQQLSQQQMSLNQMSQMLQQGMQGQLSPQQQGQMQRLAQQQEIIRKSLEELNQEARQSGKSKSMLSNLNETLKQMQEVVTDMKTERLDNDVIQKQERILSKLLDAQKSVNERDYEKERESNSAENKNRLSPAQLNLNKTSKDELMRQLYNNSKKEGYSPDYEELIKKYYELLQNNLF